MLQRKIEKATCVKKPKQILSAILRLKKIKPSLILSLHRNIELLIDYFQFD